MGGAQDTVLCPRFYLGPNAAIGYITMFSALTNSWAFARLLRLKHKQSTACYAEKHRGP